MRRALVAAIVLTGAFPAAASATELTPAGPANLIPGLAPNVGCPGGSVAPSVVVGWRVQVGEGGRAGVVRPRWGDNLVGDPVELPAEPGTYTFPAPHIPWWGWCGQSPGLVQTTGGHALIERDDPYGRILIVRYGQANEDIPSGRLTIQTLAEPDIDGDLLGDTTEDRTDLKLTAVPARDADGRLRVAVTVTNAGPLAADLPGLNTKLPGARWDGCGPPNQVLEWFRLDLACGLGRLVPGEARTMTLTDDALDAATATVTTRAEGPDLSAADNTATLSIAAPPAFSLTAAGRQRLANGVKVQVRGVRAGRARVTLAFRVHGKTLKLGRVVQLAAFTAQDVTIRPAGAKLRSLRRALANGPLRAEITVRTYSGKTPVTVKAQVTR